jgi:alkyl hydroperoxide reductase subunit AhpF
MAILGVGASVFPTGSAPARKTGLGNIRGASIAANEERTTMHPDAFDAIVIGAGQAGPALAARCSKEGLRTAMIERHHFGGTCVNVGAGGMPAGVVIGSAEGCRLLLRGERRRLAQGPAAAAG